MVESNLSIQYAANAGPSLRSKLRRPLTIQWRRPIIPELSLEQKRVINEVDNSDLLQQDPLPIAFAYDHRLTNAFIGTGRMLLPIPHYHDCHKASVLFQVGLRYCPENPACFALALAREMPNPLSEEIDQLTMAAYFHGMRVVIDGMAFSFVAGFHPWTNTLTIGVRLDKKSIQGLPDKWFDFPCVIRMQDDLISGDYFFCLDVSTPKDNYYNTAQEYAVGFVSIQFDRNRSNFEVSVIQETIPFVELCRKSQKAKGEYLKKVDQLSLWTHLTIGILESLAKELGYSKLRGINLGRYTHLYKKVFSARLDGKGFPCYKLVAPEPWPHVGFWIRDLT